MLTQLVITVGIGLWSSGRMDGEAAVRPAGLAEVVGGLRLLLFWFE